MEVSFDLTITLANVKDAKHGYDELCKLLGSVAEDNGFVLEYWTNTYQTHPDNASEPSVSGDTSELFPNLDEENN